MTVVVNSLSEDERTELRHSFGSIYIDGECYAFALALNRGLNWPLIGLISENTVRHAGVRAPNGQILDVRGFQDEERFAWHYTLPPYVIEFIDEAQLRAIRPIDETIIRRARNLAETLFPDLPWLTSTAERLRAFAKELEILSRKHGVWIYGNTPSTHPLLSLDDDNVHYELSQFTIGKFTLNRTCE
jgi:hypothetical protein